MKLKHSYLQLTSAIAVTSTLILSACQPTDQSVHIKYANGGKRGQSTEVSSRAKAPVTPELQKMITDVTSGDVYKKGLGLLLGELTKNSKIPFETFLKMKPWYVGDLNLTQLPVKALSTYSTTDSKVLTSRQSLYEVWVNLNIFNRLDDSQKAELMLQEYLTSLYLLKHISNLELCLTVMKNNHSLEDCRDRMKAADQEAEEEYQANLAEAQKNQSTQNQEEENSDEKSFSGLTAKQKSALLARIKARRPKPKPYTGKINALNATDYENIANVKKYLTTEKITLEGLQSIMKNNNFDTRIFTLKITD